MTRFQTFDQDIKLATADLAPEKIAPALAAFAKAELARVIGTGEGSKTYQRFVNGREGALEESVIAPGPILYVFSYWREIIDFALAFLNGRSPRRSGDYQAAHVVMIGGQVLRSDASIGADEEVTIVNTRPYARKIEVGHMKLSVPHLIYDDAKKAVQAKFGAVVTVRKRMINISGNYILKGHFSRGVQLHSRVSLRKDTAAGERVTYPALVMALKVAA